MTRCTECRKNVGLFGFKCKCVNASGEQKCFCSSCRFPKNSPNDYDGHVCDFDYKQLGKDTVEKNNPKLQYSKIEHI